MIKWRIFRTFRMLLRPAMYIALYISVVGYISSLHPDFFQKIPEYVSNLKSESILTFIFIVTSLLSLLYEHHLNSEKELRLEIESLNNSLKISAGIVLHKYGEFYNIYRHIMFQDILRNFVIKNSIIDSVQIYRYSILRNDDSCTIKVFFDTGYANERMDANVIMQNYYTIEEPIFTMLTEEIVPTWKRVSSSEFKSYTYLERKSVEDMLLDLLKPQFKDIYCDLRNSYIKTKTKSVFLNEDEIYTKYRLLTLLFRMLKGEKQFVSGQYLLTRYPEFPKEKSQRLKNLKSTLKRKTLLSMNERIEIIEDSLNHGKRTGLLGSILLEEIYMFRHTGNSNKKGRVYISFPLNVSGRNYIILFTISENGFNRIGDDIPRTVTNFVTEIISEFNRIA